ncbi:mRNA-decapping enzyme 1A [Bombina bombina]|uniref:mRNA-decapping enzyme 1A n=1 Tax=Bombina bombina TaxID=8345 RepID=UPI00235A4B15|nr:mRNA-decapping enzyme 1A [Bombina bombina]
MEARSKAGHEMSLAALRHTDPYINGIVDVTGQVALYSFSAKTNEWEKTDIEGTLFVYTRSASPYHGFTIMNRLNMHNLVEPVNKDLEFQLHEPFLLYRNSSLSIYSIWFYDKNDCQRIAKLMSEVVHQEAERAKNRKSPSTANGFSDRPIDILEMLSKARNVYEKGQVVNDHIGSVTSCSQKNTNLMKTDSLETMEHSIQHTQDKTLQMGQKHLTVEELFGTSLPKEQPSSSYPNIEMTEKRHFDLGGHNAFLPFSCEQSKKQPPTIVKAKPATFNLSASDFSQLSCMTPVLIPQGSVSQPDSQTVSNYPVRLSPSLCLTSTSDVLSTSVPLASSNTTGMMQVIQTAVKQVPSLMSQPVSDPSSAPHNRQFLTHLATMNNPGVSTTSHSSAELLQKLKLTPHHDPPQALPINKTTIAPKFSSVSQLATPESFKGNQMKTMPVSNLPMTSLQNVHENKETEAYNQPKSLSKVVQAANSHFVATTTTAVSSVLLSPSVFQQSTQKCIDQEDKTGTSPPSLRSIDLARSNASVFALSKAQLQDTLVHLIKNDSSFLNTIHEVYLKVLTKT